MTLPNRFAISMLSRINKNSSLPEEVMIHKPTGQILIKTTDGGIISYDSISRLRNHINIATLMSYNVNIGGSIFLMNFDDIEFPDVVQEDINIIGVTPLIIAPSNLNKILISIDIDSIERLDDESLIEFEPIVELTILLIKDLTEIPINISMQVSQLNMTVFNIVDYLDVSEDPSLYEVQISNLTIKRDIEAIGRQVKNIIHSILVIRE